MATESSARRKADPKLVITRVFDAPRELVFKAWTEAEQMKRWSGPSGFTTPLFKIDLRAGGAFSLLLPVAGGPRLVAQGCFALLGSWRKGLPSYRARHAWHQPRPQQCWRRMNKPRS